MQMKIVDRSFYICFAWDILVPIVYLVWFITYFLNNVSFDCGLTKNIVLLFIFGISFALIAFCLVVSQWIYLLKKFKYSSIVIEAEEITFFDKDFRMSFLNSEIKKN